MTHFKLFILLFLPLLCHSWSKNNNNERHLKCENCGSRNINDHTERNWNEGDSRQRIDDKISSNHNYENNDQGISNAENRERGAGGLNHNKLRNSNDDDYNQWNQKDGEKSTEFNGEGIELRSHHYNKGYPRPNYNERIHKQIDQSTQNEGRQNYNERIHKQIDHSAENEGIPNNNERIYEQIDNSAENEGRPNNNERIHGQIDHSAENERENENKYKDTNTEDFFISFSKELEILDRKLQKFCKEKNSDNNIKEIYDTYDYKMKLTMPNFEERDISVNIRNRVIQIIAQKYTDTENKLEQIKVLPDFVNSYAAKWKISKGKMTVIIPYKQGFTTEIEVSCGIDNGEEQIINVPNMFARQSIDRNNPAIPHGNTNYIRSNNPSHNYQRKNYGSQSRDYLWRRSHNDNKEKPSTDFGNNHRASNNNNNYVKYNNECNNRQNQPDQNHIKENIPNINIHYPNLGFDNKATHDTGEQQNQDNIEERNGGTHNSDSWRALINNNNAQNQYNHNDDAESVKEKQQPDHKTYDITYVSSNIVTTGRPTPKKNNSKEESSEEQVNSAEQSSESPVKAGNHRTYQKPSKSYKAQK